MAPSLLRAVSWLLVALAVVLALQSLVDMFSPATSEAARARGGAIAFVGLLVQTVFLGGLAVGLRRMAERLQSGSGLSWEAEQLADILDKRRAEIPLTPPRLVADYERLTDRELLDVYFRIDAPAHPERFQALLWVIAQRAAALEPRPATVHAG